MPNFGGADFGGFPGFGGVPGGGGGTRTFHFSTGGGGGGGAGGFSFTNPEDIFAEFMRSAGTGRGGAGMGAADDDFDMFGGMGGGRGGPRMKASGPDFRRQAPTTEVMSVDKPLPVALEDLFRGVTKKMKIKAKRFDNTGKQITKDQILEVPIKAGLKKGSKIKFKGVGDQVEGGRQDLHFIIEEVSIFCPFFFFFLSEVCRVANDGCRRNHTHCLRERITT